MEVTERRKIRRPEHIGRAGFSFVELTVVLTILMGMVVVAVPSLLTLRSGAAVRSGAREFVRLHALAQAAAVQWGTVAELHVANAPLGLWVEVDTGGVGMDTIGYASDLEPGLMINSDRFLLCFDARGVATSTGSCEDGAATVVFVQGEASDTVQTTSLGLRLR